MFRLLTLASLMAFAAAQTCYDCSCLTCAGRRAFSDEYDIVTINGNSCKNGATISWICCTGTNSGMCQAVGNCATSNKCETVTSVDFYVPVGSTTMSTEMHDGKTADGPKAIKPNNQQAAVCSGGQTITDIDADDGGFTTSSGGCANKVCVDVIDISTGPNGCGPIQPPGGGGGAGGDPHIRTWEGQWFDFSGECDLVLASAPAFNHGLGLDVHIRTKIRYDYSYISNAALKIGDEVLEVASFGDYLLNGVSGAQLPASLAGFPVSYTKVNDLEHAFSVDLGHDQFVRFKVFKDLVTVKFEGATEYDFNEAHGLMGDFNTRQLLGRNGTALATDNFDVFAQEWQVTDMDAQIFASKRAPQYPAKCIMPEQKVDYGSFLRFDASTN